jgi:hypothetical protein
VNPRKQNCQSGKKAGENDFFYAVDLHHFYVFFMSFEDVSLLGRGDSRSWPRFGTPANQG